MQMKSDVFALGGKLSVTSRPPADAVCGRVVPATAWGNRPALRTSSRGLDEKIVSPVCSAMISSRNRGFERYDPFLSGDEDGEGISRCSAMRVTVRGIFSLQVTRGSRSKSPCRVLLGMSECGRASTSLWFQWLYNL